MTIVLDTPTQINAWVVLSRIHQAEMHMKGFNVKGLNSWLRKNVPGATAGTVKGNYIALLDYADSLDLPHHLETEEMCNYFVLVKSPAFGDLHFDCGIVGSLAEVQSEWGERYAQGDVVIVRTMEAPREGSNAVYRFE